MPYDYTASQPEQFRVKTVIAYTEDPEIREYILDSDELSAFVADLEDPQIFEEVIDITAHAED